MVFYKTFFRIELLSFVKVYRSYFRRITRFIYKRKIVVKALQSVLWKYWNTSWSLILWVSTDTIWNFQLSSFLKIISLHLNHVKFQWKADYQSHAITLVHPDTIINKKISVTLHWLNLMFRCYQFTTPPQLQMLIYYNNNTLKSTHYTGTNWNFQVIIFLLLRNKLHSL